MPAKTPYTFAIYSNGSIVPNVYGTSGVTSDGDVIRGQARTMGEALGYAQMAADAAWRLPGLTVMIWRHGRMVNIPSSFNLRELTIRRAA